MRALIPMLLVLATAAAAAPVRSDAEAERYHQCLALAASDAGTAIVKATQWRAAGGGVPARHCLALAQGTQGRFAEAAATLTGAAQAAEAEADPHAADLWGQAGNAYLLAGKTPEALGAFGSGITAAGSEPIRLAALLTDRGRALVEQNRSVEARADLARATTLDAKSVDAWLLLATLERRQHDLKAAEAAILRAAQLAPGDADVALEAGNIAGAEGRLDLARQQWRKVVTGAPGSAAATDAAKSLALNPG